MTPETWLLNMAITVIIMVGLAVINYLILYAMLKKDVQRLGGDVAYLKKELDTAAPTRSFRRDIGDLIVGGSERPNLTESVTLLYNYLNVEKKTTPEETKLVKRKKAR